VKFVHVFSIISIFSSQSRLGVQVHSQAQKITIVAARGHWLIVQGPGHAWRVLGHHVGDSLCVPHNLMSPNLCLDPTRSPLPQLVPSRQAEMLQLSCVFLTSAVSTSGRSDSSAWGVVGVLQKWGKWGVFLVLEFGGVFYTWSVDQGGNLNLFLLKSILFTSTKLEPQFSVILYFIIT
jgi:hypothetical protein